MNKIQLLICSGYCSDYCSGFCSGCCSGCCFGFCSGCCSFDTPPCVIIVLTDLVRNILSMVDFFNEIKKLLSEDDFKNFLKSYDKEPYRGLRVNTLKCDSEKLCSLLGQPLVKTPFCTDGFYIKKENEITGNNPLHHAGAYYMQEPSAMSAVTMLSPKRGDYVLDLCAAPGGKSTQIAASLDGEGLLWSNEIVKNRANILLSNIERCGVRNAVVSSCHPDVLCKSLSGFFDKVLVDAPCSGEGMFRRDENAYSEWSTEHVSACAVRQLQILNSAKNALKDGGELVYSTCTFSYEENEGVITQFLKENPEFEIVNSGESFGRNTLDFAKRIYPMDGGEGHFAVKLIKKGYSGFTPVKPHNEKIPQQIYDCYDSAFVNRPFGDKLTVIKDRVYALPCDLPNLSGLNVLRAGVLLATIKKNRVEPEHSAFMAAKPLECKNYVNFDLQSELILKFLHGEEIKIQDDIKGFTAVCVNNITTGFGKASNNVLKNKYPKGLRIL